MPEVWRQLSSIAISIALVLSAGVAEAQRHNPKKAKLHERRAKAARNLKQWNLTAAEYRKAYEYWPRPQYLFNIGLASDFAGKKEQAIQAFRDYLAKEPNGTYAVTARAKLKELTAAIEQARQEALQAQLARHLGAAKGYHESGKHDAAAFEYRKAYELTKNPEYLFEVAESYRRAGAKGQALDSYREYLKADGTGKFAISARKQIEALEKPPAQKPTLPVRDLTPTLAPDFAANAAHVATVKPKKRKNKWLWMAAGAAVIAAGIAADTLPSSGSNGTLDAMDLVPVGLYGVGITAVVVGAF